MKYSLKNEVENKIATVVSDNPYNIVGAIATTNWRHVPCFAHCLNLAVQGNLKKKKNLQEILKKSESNR